ncbi:hypothetical protein DAPPUDRAFT_246351 [Daphnia pulex]|uniref:Uncharacterized protein n=1 Tax=Daphnia pulex TaxID=6669 RepID=E9GQ95_DAPPU|nr:hypothetical protein DAPPUDRAFT_246351 [Daphnia pulex]|eukprot:EFX78381.1 hypothetical protein DAPPUDRAFT_246351 [Daphnia pulex]
MKKNQAVQIRFNSNRITFRFNRGLARPNISTSSFVLQFSRRIWATWTQPFDSLEQVNVASRNSDDSGRYRDNLVPMVEMSVLCYQFSGVLPGCVNGDVGGQWTEQPFSLIIWSDRLPVEFEYRDTSCALSSKMQRKPIGMPLVRKEGIATDGRVTGNIFFFASVAEFTLLKTEDDFPVMLEL